MTTTAAPFGILRQADIALALMDPPLVGKRLLEPIRSLTAAQAMPLNILEERGAASDAEVHARDGDLWCCLEGAVTFTCGGTLTESWVPARPDGTPDPHERKGKGIVGGTQIVLHPGDWFWIPAGVPHIHAAGGIARLVIVKIPCR